MIDLPEKNRAFNRKESWHIDAVVYQVHVKSFFDSTGDGSGDFRGLIGKLDYIRDLGATALWLLPFYPSPLKDDGYDISDYRNVNPAYGTMDDFKDLLKEAHARGLYVITELVLNHTSDQHPWFQQARTAESDSPERDFYVWSDDTARYKEARIIFQDFETSNWAWDPVAQAYFWHRFFSHQPDLNFDNPKVHEALMEVLDFWLDMGVDGLRLDAVPYLYERDGTTCENLPETHAFLKKISAHVKSKYDNRMLLAEANQWPEDAAAYFGDGDECQMAFHFPLLPRLYMSVEMEDRFPIMDILSQTPKLPRGCQWAIFLRNHDELTLEMVTDEERDFMVRVYARDQRARINLGIRRRLAPLMENNRRKIELLHNLILSLPGAPILYYGDEIGMGDNFYLGDRNGVRTPMQWSPDRNAGFSHANSQRLFLPVVIDSDYHYHAVNVENQEHNPNSLLWWLRRRIALRNRHKAFSVGELKFLIADNIRILAFLRCHEGETLLILINLSKHPQSATLDLSEFSGYSTLEMTSGNRFPEVGTEPFPIMLGSHESVWLELLPPNTTIHPDSLPTLSPMQDIEEMTQGERAHALWQTVLPQWLAKMGMPDCRLEPMESFRLPGIPSSVGRLILARNISLNANGSLVAIPLMFSSDTSRLSSLPYRIAKVTLGGQEGYLYDATGLPEGAEALACLFVSPFEGKGHAGELKVWLRDSGNVLPIPTKTYQTMIESEGTTTLGFSDFGVLTFLRQVPNGSQPDPEITLFLRDWAGFQEVPKITGLLEWHPNSGTVSTVAYLQSWVKADRNAENLVHDFFEKTMVAIEREGSLWVTAPEVGRIGDVLEMSDLPQVVQDALGGPLLEFLDLLGERIAKMHLALASETEAMEFRPQPYDWHYQIGVYQSIRSLINRHFSTLERSIHSFEPRERTLAKGILEQRNAIQGELHKLRRELIDSLRIRIHGNLELDVILFNGKDFIIQGFEGDPHRPFNERRFKYSALRDVASLIRSIQEAAIRVCGRLSEQRTGDGNRYDNWGNALGVLGAGLFLSAYLRHASGHGILPVEKTDRQILLQSFLMEKSVQELGNELESGSEGLPMALRKLAALLKASRIS